MPRRAYRREAIPPTPQCRQHGARAQDPTGARWYWKPTLARDRKRTPGRPIPHECHISSGCRRPRPGQDPCEEIMNDVMIAYLRLRQSALAGTTSLIELALTFTF